MNEEITNKIADVTSRVSLELIFNRHADINDAMNSVAQVEPRSLVFVEGIDNVGFSEDSLVVIERRLGSLALSRSDHYQSLKEDVIASLLPSDEHNPNLHKALLNKDCFVFQADYSKNDFPEDMHIIMEEWYEERKHDVGRRGIGKEIKALVTNKGNILMYHDMREQLAVAKSVSLLVDLFDEYGFDGLSRHMPVTEDRKIKVYSVWGSGHADSLTDKYRSYGFSTHSINLKEAGRRLPVNIDNLHELAFKHAMADLLSKLIIYSSAYNVDDPNTIIFTLHKKLPIKSGSEYMPAAIRALQLLEQMEDAFSCPEEEDGPPWSSVVLNLWVLLEDLNIDPSELIEYPYKA